MSIVNVLDFKLNLINFLHNATVANIFQSISELIVITNPNYENDAETINTLIDDVTKNLEIADREFFDISQELAQIQELRNLLDQKLSEVRGKDVR